MATIIDRNPRQEWWQPLAVNILGGLWNEYQQRERNKKENALAAEAARVYSELANGSQGSGQDTQGMLGSTGGNGWDNALHQSINPLGEFDTATQGAAPAMLQPMTQPTRTAPRQPTPLELQTALTRLRGTRRFGGVDAATAQNIFAPFMKLNDEARQRQERTELANALGGAGSIQDWLKILSSGGIQGTIDANVMNNLYNMNKPTEFTRDRGKTVDYGTYSPGFGYNTVGSYDKQLSPQEELSAEQWTQNFNEKQRQFNANQKYNYASLGQQDRHFNAELELKRNQTGTPFQQADGHFYVMKNGQPERISETPGLTPDDRTEITSLETRLKQIETLKERYHKTLADLVTKGYGDTPQAEEVKRMIQGLDREQNSINSRITGIYSSRRNVNQARQVQGGNLPPVAKTVDTSVGTGNTNTVSADVVTNNPNGITVEVTPLSPDIPAAGSSDIHPNASTASADAAANSNDGVLGSILHFANRFNPFAATPAAAEEIAPRNGDTTNQQAAQTALNNLNGQFNTPRSSSYDNWNDYVLGANPQSYYSSASPRPQSSTLTNFDRNMAYRARNTAPTSATAPANITPPANVENPANTVTHIGFTGNNAPNKTRMAAARNITPQQTFSGRYTDNPMSVNRYSDIIKKHAKRYNVDPDLVAAIIEQESGWRSNAVSSAGARGLMQLMPKTAAWLGVKNSFDPDQNIGGGVKYIAQMLQRYKGNVEKALWAYNAGPGNADKGRLPAETKNYIPSVMARYRRIKSGQPAPTANTEARTTSAPKRRRRSRKTRR